MATKYTYTPAEVEQIVAKYKSGTTLETLAGEYSKSVASVRMKLVKQGVYKAANTATKVPSQSENKAHFYKCLDLVGEAWL